MGANIEKKRCRINKNLITLKVVVFFVFLGITSIHALCTYQHKALGLNFKEYRLISILAPLISTIGPLIVGPLADKLASRNATTYGRSLRYLTAFLLIVGSVLYACLLLIPSVERIEARRPLVSFGCDASGAVIFQERCTEEGTCHHWSHEKFGSLILTNCSYTCQKPSQYEFLYKPWTQGSPLPPTEVSSDSEWERDYDEGRIDATTESLNQRKRRHGDSKDSSDFTTNSIEEGVEVFSSEEVDREKRELEIPNNPINPLVNPPHICIKKRDSNGNEYIDKCHVYTEDTQALKVQATLRSATNKENDTHSADWCNYPLDGFQCDIPDKQIWYMKSLKNDTPCKPMMECEVIAPYDNKDSVLVDSTCIRTVGDVDCTVYGYGALRIIAEIFPLAALTLLNTAIVIATRETSSGRGEVCRQYAWGALAWASYIPHSDVIGVSYTNMNDYIIALTVTAVISFAIAAVTLLFAQGMPLSPPEWWWHTKTGMLVYPMSAIRKYSPEMIALLIITLILGTFFGSIHSYMLYLHVDYHSISALGILFVLLLLFNVDRFIEFCGHSNILIGTFAFYIIRFTAIAIIPEGVGWFAILTEIIEPLVLGLSWITVILYMRHIVPRRFTATGQAAIVIAYFCLGKCYGALIGLVIDSKNPMDWNCMYHGLAIAACVISIIYFILYNLILSPRCTAKPQPLPELTTNLASQTGHNGSATNGANGNYTPLRVYHNERGKKGQFRY